MSGFFGKALVATWIASALLWATNQKLGSALVYDVWYVAIAVVFAGAIVALIGSKRLQGAHGSFLYQLIALGVVATLGGPITVRLLQSL